MYEVAGPLVGRRILLVVGEFMIAVTMEECLSSSRTRRRGWTGPFWT
jgi:hypothetical protein